MKKQYGEKMEAWLKKQPMRDGNGLSISDTYTKIPIQPFDHKPTVDTKKLNEYRALMLGHGWREPKVVENVLPYLKSKIT